MTRRKDKVHFTTASEALDYIHKIFPEDTEDQHGFIFQFELLVRSARSLSSQRSKGQLLTDGEINEELETLISATDRYLKTIKKLRASTKKNLDREYIRAHLDPEEELPQHVKEDVLISDFTLPLQNDESGKTSITVQIGKLIKLLDEVKKYCKSGMSKSSGRDASDFKKLEWGLAQEYQKTEQKINRSEDGEFANILKAFHRCSGIKEYDSNQIDNKYIDRIIKGAKKNWEDKWRINLGK